ncbi:hypothetical protein [Actinobaculum sp. 313]|uniref:hypothetical protein n=1 Tax=Actinobaculum sp. 313 TaxID=2495645 RepID=UPI000D5261F2|nr:hypothetical protein [Actinobaculum sp. 313]AWE43167.1 hypothetical protein DDD63_10900 [Actinobaculum sp. 313]
MKHRRTPYRALAAFAVAGLIVSGCGNSAQEEATTSTSTTTDGPTTTLSEINSELTDEEIVAKAKEVASQNRESFFTHLTQDRNLHLEISREVTTAVGEEPRSIDSVIDIRVDSSTQTLEIKASEADGQAQPTETTSYFKYDGETATVYSFDSGTWSSSTVSANEIASISPQSLNDVVLDTGVAYSWVAMLADAEVARDGEDSYTITGKVTPESFSSYFDGNVTAESDSPGTLTLSVDAESFELYEWTIELDTETTDHVINRNDSLKTTIRATAERDPDVDLEIPAAVLDAAGDPADSGDN